MRAAPFSPRHRHGRLDAVTYLTAVLVLAFAIESRYVIGPLGGAGTPAQVLAVGGLCWWMYFHTARAWSAPWQVQPVRIALLGLFLCFCASYAVAMSRPITGLESSSATLGLVSLGGWLGVALLAHDGVPDSERLDAMLRRLVLAGTLLAALGIGQFVFNTPLIRWFTVPGLQLNIPLGDLSIRGSFTRPFGTTLHPIEFGAVLTTLLPVAIARARSHPTAGRIGPWVCVFLLAVGMVVCNSRSAVLSTLVGLTVLSAIWSARTRLYALAGALGILGFVVIALPGLTGSLLSLFGGAGEDGSIASRTGSYELVGEFVSRNLWFGRGGSTFLPSYRILDNQYLLTLIELGVIGLLAFLAVLAAAFLSARQARLIACGPAHAERAQGLAAGVAAAAFGLGTYDGLSFPVATTILFIVVGLTGAAYRLERQERLERAGTPAQSTPDQRQEASWPR
ncbi:O-antigen ligase family protein [Nocardioides insulae]|uniref:O-antigen ligase family protein n=1 Tax=Nocardioides insulae TaxID=394734 RepID=UPI00040CF7FE|nr:O-antigen ligase family protein [Nocardioides insulae]